MKKRRSSTSDKPNDVIIGETHKKSKVLETCDIYNRNNFSQSTKLDNPVFVQENNNIDKKCEGKNEPAIITANGKGSAPPNQQVCNTYLLSSSRSALATACMVRFDRGSISHRILA